MGLHNNKKSISTQKTLFRILFVAEATTLAHVTRPIVLANALDKQRFKIIFACGQRYRSFIESSGHESIDIPTISPEIFLERLAKGKPLYTYDKLKEYVNAELKLLSATSPDLVVGDFRLSLGISTDILKLPYIALSNAHWSPYSTQPFPIPEHPILKLIGVKISKHIFPSLLSAIFWYHSRPFNNLRKSFGLSPVGSLKHVYSYGKWTLYLDVPSIAPTRDIPDNHRYIGPVIWSPDVKLPEWWNEIPDNMPIIYVTMGSSGDISLLEKILKALEDTPFVGLVATAGRIKIKPASKNIYIADYLPGIEIIKKASLVIFNGGSATAYQALSLGVPVLGFPSNADQFFTMESVQQNRAGILIRPMKASKDIIMQSINNILDNKEYKGFAKKLASEISTYDCKKLFSDFIDSL
jgi:UDP:flavonoid glycosyltransferase YjiC (YdhE family)